MRDACDYSLFFENIQAPAASQFYRNCLRAAGEERTASLRLLWQCVCGKKAKPPAEILCTDMEQSGDSRRFCVPARMGMIFGGRLRPFNAGQSGAFPARTAAAGSGEEGTADGNASLTQAPQARIIPVENSARRSRCAGVREGLCTTGKNRLRCFDRTRRAAPSTGRQGTDRGREQGGQKEEFLWRRL